MADYPDDKVPPPPRPPSLSDLAKLKVSDWLKVGNILGLKEYDLEIIKRQHSRQRDTSHACQVAMFGKWLRDHSSPTARDVIIALRKAGETRAADELSRKYGEESTEQQALVPLPEPKRSVASHKIVATGPEKSGKQAIFDIATEIIEENQTELLRLIERHRHLLQQNQWVHFLSLLNYHLPAVTFHDKVDMGELPELMEMAPILLRGPLFHFICFNLTQDMTEPVETTVNVGTHQSTCYTSCQSVKQFVCQAVEILTAVNLPWGHVPRSTSREHHTTAIVGVHSGDSRQVLTELPRVDADLKKHVESSGATRAVRYCHHQENRMIFSLNLFQPHNKTRVKDVLRQVMAKHTTDSLQVETSAYNLLSLLYFRGGVLNLSECKYVARLCGVRMCDLTSLLKAIHDRLGLILYFHQVPKMKNLVVCGSDCLIGPLESFTAVALSGTSKCPQIPSIVRKTGEISLSLIDDMKSREEPGDKVTISCLLELLKYYKFLSETEDTDGTMVYFMPCLLQPDPLLGNKCSEEQIASLLFCFKCEHSPHLLFTALMAQLARNWKFAHGTRYKNCITFIVNNTSLTKITLKDKGDHFELSAGIGLPQEYSHIRQEVQRALHYIKIRYTHLSSVVCRVGFYCSHSVQSRLPHCAFVSVVNGEGFLQCHARRCQKGRVPLSKKMKIWFSGEKQLNERAVDGFVNLLADISLSSDIDEEDIVQQIEAHIVEEGSIPLRVVRCGLFGAPGVGKTSSMKRLTNEIENLQGMPSQPSTGIEPPITVSLYGTTQQLPVLITDQEWNPQDLDSQLQTILQCIITTDDGTPLPGLVTTADPPATGQTGSLSAPTKPSTSPTQPNLSTAHSTPPSPVSSQSMIPQPEASCSPTTTDLNLPSSGQKFDPHYIRNLIKRKSWMKIRNILKEFEDVTLLNIVDTGGQPEYQDILPVLLGGSGLSLLFFNLTQDPEKTYPIVYRHADEGTQSREYRSQLSILEMLFQVLATLTNTSSEQHAAILVGTHLDQLMGRNEVNSFERKVLNALKETEFHKKDVIKSFQAFGEERIVFPLDNMTGSQAEIKQLQGIINEVAEHFQHRPLPTSWLLFHLALRYQFEKKPGYCTMEECKQLAARCGINEKDVPRILSYFHKNFGTILYFPDVPCLREVVICNPSIIFTAINSLVAESFTNNPFNPHTSHSIRETGEIARTILDRICASDTTGGTLRTQHIIELLKYHHIITEIQSTDHSEGMALFMPCLLHYCDEQETLEKLHELNPAPLFIHFSRGYIPNGFFTGYIVGLAEEWMLEPKRYKNRVSFIIDKTLVAKCTLTLHYNHIQVQVQAQESNEVCICIRQTLMSVIDAMRKKFAYLEGIEPKLRLLCPASIDSKYFATCLDTESPEKMHCVTCNRHDLLPKHKIWFSSYKDVEEPMCTEEIQPTASVTRTPSVSSIQKYSPHMTIRKPAGSDIPQQSASDTEKMDVCDANNKTVVASSKLLEVLTVGDIRRLTNDLHEVFSIWYTLGMNLDVSLSSLDQIDHDCKECSMCMIKMLKVWINSGTATRAQLVQALREPSIKQNAVANKIEESNQ